MSGFGQLAEQYDGFIIDLWGVVHNGVRLLPGVLDTLSRLRALGKRVVFLTNAPRRVQSVSHRLASLGVTPDLYDGIMSSGEAVHLGLRERAEEFATLGWRLYHLGPPRDRDLFETLAMYQEVSDPAAADFVLNTGPDVDLDPHDAGRYRPVLEAGLKAGLPMICANPDLEVAKDGKPVLCAGLLAQIYRAGGGVVIERGKPHPAIYAPVLAMLGTARERTLAVGDSLRTDIAGAAGLGIDALWMLSGIHAVSPAEARAHATAAGLAPKAILPDLHW